MTIYRVGLGACRVLVIGSRRAMVTVQYLAFGSWQPSWRWPTSEDTKVTRGVRCAVCCQRRTRQSNGLVQGVSDTRGELECVA